MKIGLITDAFSDKELKDVLPLCNELGVEAIELSCGNWSDAPHIDLDNLLQNDSERQELLNLCKENNIEISSLNCSGNPLFPFEKGEDDRTVVNKTFQLAEKLGVEKIVMMSGLPGGGPNDEYPNWVTTSWPPVTQEIIEYQWEKAFEYWSGMSDLAKKYNVKKIAIEPHGSQLVYNVENFYKLRECTGDILGFNLDPSHLFWMNSDPISIIQELGDAIYHVHIKDVRVEETKSKLNSLLDTKIPQDFAARSWNFAIPGYGHDETYWKNFLINLKMIGYDDVISIEHEDYTMDIYDGVSKTIELLKKIRI
jgi:sugar phosphate isomerase/epimerase